MEHLELNAVIGFAGACARDPALNHERHLCARTSAKLLDHAVVLAIFNIFQPWHSVFACTQ
eukprot:1929193-Rhodomonas_salina.2